MSMKPAPFPEPDPQVAAAVRAIWPRPDRAPLAVAVRDRLGGWLRDEDFAAAFGARGRPGYSPAVLALVTVLQQAENLTGRLAAENARRALDWKYALGLPLDGGGFDFSVLSEFRARAAQGGLEAVALDVLLGRLSADGLVRAGGKQRTDSTHVAAAVAALNRLELAGESVRAALEALAAAHPDWTAGVLDASRARKSEDQLSKAEYSNAILYPEAPNMPMGRAMDFINNGPVPAITTQGVISDIYIQTDSGWIYCTNGTCLPGITTVLAG